MSTHSPGPWYFSKLDYAVYREGGWRCVAAFSSECGLPTVADARLMAAAPDLLEACELARSQLSCDCGFPCCNTCDTIRRLDSAIKKARGEQ